MASEQVERHFTRIPFKTDTSIISQDGSESWSCTLLDISLHGALTKLPEKWSLQCGDNCSLELGLGDTDDENLKLHMNVKVIHMERDHIGFEIMDMDVDTASHLRKLVEFNTGDIGSLERDIHALLRLHNSSAVS